MTDEYARVERIILYTGSALGWILIVGLIVAFVIAVEHRKVFPLSRKDPILYFPYSALYIVAMVIAQLHILEVLPCDVYIIALYICFYMIGSFLVAMAFQAYWLFRFHAMKVRLITDGYSLGGPAAVVLYKRKLNAIRRYTRRPFLLPLIVVQSIIGALIVIITAAALDDGEPLTNSSTDYSRDVCVYSTFRWTNNIITIIWFFPFLCTMVALMNFGPIKRLSDGLKIKRDIYIPLLGWIFFGLATMILVFSFEAYWSNEIFLLLTFAMIQSTLVINAMGARNMYERQQNRPRANSVTISRSGSAVSVTDLSAKIFPRSNMWERLSNEPACKKGFYDFLESEMALEELVFLEAVHDFAYTEDPASLNSKFLEIYDLYISEDAIAAVNLPFAVSGPIHKFRSNYNSLTQVPNDLFYKSARSVLKTLEHDAFLRFMLQWQPSDMDHLKSGDMEQI